MTDAVRDSYDAKAKLYASFNLHDLDRVPLDREWLGAFARLASPGTGVVADVGCGPGHVVHYLAELSVKAIGYDISPAMIDEAQRAFPGSKFQVGDLTALDIADSSLAGIVARYSLIHLPPAQLTDVFGEWFRVLKPRAPVLVSFFASSSSVTHGLPFDHAVVTAHELFPETVVAEMQTVGFDSFEVSTRKPQDGERPLDHGTILARRGSSGGAHSSASGRAIKSPQGAPRRESRSARTRRAAHGGAPEMAYPESLDHMLAAWNETEPDKIRGHLEKALSPKVEFIDPSVVARGLDEFEANVHEVHARLPGAEYLRASAVDSHHDLHRYAWEIRRDGELVLPGFDVTEVDDEGRVLRVLGFFGPLPEDD